MNTIFFVFLGGGLGSVARYGLSRWVTGNFTTINPIGTLVTNILSTVILGVVVFFFLKGVEERNPLYALLVIGFCGGFSTFSTLSFEVFELLRLGSYSYALLIVLISMLLGVGVLFLLSKIV